ncbi:hypothetical protein MRX96_034531 [Rhipicephalus microplus]
MLRHGPGRLAHGEEGRIVLVFEVADDSEQKKSEDSAPFSWSEATQSFCCYPLKVFVPREAGQPCCRWVYPIVFGGGLVSGDAVHIDLTAATGTCVLLTSQSSTSLSRESGLCNAVPTMCKMAPCFVCCPI